MSEQTLPEKFENLINSIPRPYANRDEAKRLAHDFLHLSAQVNAMLRQVKDLLAMERQQRNTELALAGDRSGQKSQSAKDSWAEKDPMFIQKQDAYQKRKNEVDYYENMYHLCLNYHVYLKSLYKEE